MIAAAVFNAQGGVRGRALSHEDFFPAPEEEAAEQSVEEQLAVFEMIAAVANRRAAKERAQGQADETPPAAVTEPDGDQPEDADRPDRG